MQILRVTLGIDHCSMEISRTKAELIKPVFLAVGIPLAFSLASLILEKIRAKKSSFLKSSPSDIRVNTLENNYPESNSHEYSWKEEILDLRKKVELQEREMMMETKFLRYHELKVQEFVLMGVEYNLLLELERAEFMDMEVSSTEEEENQIFEEMVKEILNALEEPKSSRSENVMLHQRIKKLLKRLKRRMRDISKQTLQIQEMEAVISSKDTEIERKSDMIKKLEDETEELQMAIQSLQEEKNELLKKLEMAESPARTKSEPEKETTKDYDRVVNELEQLQKDRAAETKELIYLRWCNACLRHKLFRMNQEQGVKSKGKKTEAEESPFISASGDMKEFGFENESDSSSLAHVDQSVDPSTSFNSRGSNGHPKRRKLYEKFKKWVEGGGEKVRKNKMEDKKKPELKYFGSHSVADCGDETHFSASKSPNSA